MNLIIDAGNTQIKWAVYSEGRQQEKGAAGYWTDFPFDKLGKIVNPNSSAIFSSVRDFPEEVKLKLKHLTGRIYELTYKLPLPVKLRYKTLPSLGKDRIAAAVGGAYLFPGLAVLIIDMGTAITFDLVNEHGEFIGGNISPGMGLRYKSLGAYTKDLPLLRPAESIINPGQSTKEAIQTGVQLGIQYEIDAYINALINKYDKLRVILTGGDASFFVKNLKNTIFVVPDLVLDGLNLILEYQKGQIKG